MNKKEFDALVKQMHEKGLDDDKIMQVLYEAFVNKTCDIDDYELMVKWLGYELNDEFYEYHGLTKHKRK